MWGEPHKHQLLLSTDPVPPLPWVTFSCSHSSNSTKITQHQAKLWQIFCWEDGGEANKATCGNSAQTCVGFSLLHTSRTTLGKWLQFLCFSVPQLFTKGIRELHILWGQLGKVQEEGSCCFLSGYYQQAVGFLCFCVRSSSDWARSLTESATRGS